MDYLRRVQKAVNYIESNLNDPLDLREVAQTAGFSLFYFHRMDIRETAMSLGIAEGTVKARLHRGRALLRRKLRPTFEPKASRENRE